VWVVSDALPVGVWNWAQMSRGRDSSVGIATRYGLDGPGIESRWGARFFRTSPDRPLWGPPSLLYDGYRVFHRGVKRPGRGADHPPPSMCRGHERVELYLYSHSGPSWPVIGRTFTFTFYTSTQPLTLYWPTFVHQHMYTRSHIACMACHWKTVLLLS
jgi:hypothetical protein